MTHILYRLYDKHWNLLYIGATESFFWRIKGHRAESVKKPWFRRVSFVQMQHLRTRKGCFAAERKAINKEQPKYNIKRDFKS